MSKPIVECVPNISEGRDKQKIEEVVAAARAVDGVEVLDVDPGFETNRTVITLVGAPDAVAEGAFRLVARAAALIDMSKHEGAHPRHGATDVCPFIPVADMTMADCVALARRVGERIGTELGIPVYLYDQAALLPERRSLAKVRAGEYEALPEKLAKPEWKPDHGPAEFNARTGVITVGAREFLIAYNVNLNSNQKEHADDLAWEIRETGRALRKDPKTAFYNSGSVVKYHQSKGVFPSAYDDFTASSLEELAKHYRDVLGRDLHAELEFFGRDPKSLEGVNVMKTGTFRECRAVGWVIPEYDRAQISINLTNFRVTAMHDVTEACRAMAQDRGLVATGSEVVGVVPWEALRDSGLFYLERRGSSRGLPVKDIAETAVQSLGLRDVAEFEVERSVLGMPTTEGRLASMRVNDLADEVSRPSPAPGGGSIAALAGALGASLSAMVANLSHAKKGFEDLRPEFEANAVRCQEVKDELLRAIDADTDAFNDVISAMRMPKTTDAERAARDAAIQDGYKLATSVPLRTAELCLEVIHLCRLTTEKGNPASITDAGVGAMMARSALIGAIYNVRINLDSITDEAWVEDARSKLKSMQDEGERAEREVRDLVEAAIS